MNYYVYGSLQSLIASHSFSPGLFTIRCLSAYFTLNLVVNYINYIIIIHS